MKAQLARRLAIASLMTIGSAVASPSPEDSGLSLAGGYSQVKLSSAGSSITPSGTDFAVRAVYAYQLGPFVKSEYERSDTTEKRGGAKADFTLEEVRLGLGYAFPIAPNVKIYPAADYLINIHEGKSGGTTVRGTDHGYFVGGGGSAKLGDTTVYFRGGYGHLQGYGVTTTGPDLLLGAGVDLSELAALFIETRYAPISNDNLDYDFWAIRAGVKLKF